MASRLAVARIQLDKFGGFVDGVRLFADLIENFWDKLYPPKKRMRGRMGAIEWWLEKTEVLLGQEEPAPTPAEKLDELKNELKRLDDLFIENLKDPPMLRSLERFVESVPAIAQKVPEPESEPAPGPVAEQKPETVEPEVEKPAEKKAAPAPQSALKPSAAAPPADYAGGRCVGCVLGARRRKGVACGTGKRPKARGFSEGQQSDGPFGVSLHENRGLDPDRIPSSCSGGKQHRRCPAPDPQFHGQHTGDEKQGKLRGLGQGLGGAGFPNIVSGWT